MHRIAVALASVVAMTGMPAAAAPFDISITGFVTGQQFDYSCGLPGSSCLPPQPYSTSVDTGYFVLDLQEGANSFSYGSPYSALGALSGTIIDTGGVLSGRDLSWSRLTCSHPPQPGCLGLTGTAATFAVNGGVPEPASWALMVAGFGAVGFALRRRRDLPGSAVGVATVSALQISR